VRVLITILVISVAVFLFTHSANDPAHPTPGIASTPALDPPTSFSQKTSSHPVVVNSEGKIVLTFDDSDESGIIITQILDILSSQNVKAIFFPIGNWAHTSGAPYVQRMLREGHLVCNHTKSHKKLTLLSRKEIVKQILGGAGVGSCNLLRPPYGAYNSFVAQIAKELGYQIYLWTIDSRDWALRDPGGDQEIIHIVLSQARPGSIVLFHMNVKNTLKALPYIIEGLRAKGYELGY